ncbi:hypothetical protein QTP70_014461, partial [Hemibagrus guttatus]
VVPVTTQTFRHEYFMITTPSTWADAKAYCKSKYLNLATVRTDDDWYRLNAAAESKGLAATGWVGLFIDAYSWYWSNTAIYMMTTASYWAPGQPDNLGGNEECCAIDSTGSWADYPCTDLKPFICFNGKPCKHLHCSPNLIACTQKTEAATGAIFAYTTLMSWWGGQTYCKTYHTDLARAITSTQNSQLQQVAATQGTSWFGLYRDTWLWLDWTSPLLVRWSPGLPNNVDHDDNCAMTTNNLLFDRQCNNLYNFFCHIQYKIKYEVVKLQIQGDESVFDPVVQSAILQKGHIPFQEGRQPPEAPRHELDESPQPDSTELELRWQSVRGWVPVPGDEIGCPHVWIFYQHSQTQMGDEVGKAPAGALRGPPVAMQTFRHDYYMITTPSTWADANAYCKSKYLNLATVRTDDDWYRLNAAAESKGLEATGWVGLFLDVYDWYWSNTVVYLMTTASYWAPGQPDNLGGNEECCAIDSTGSWADYPCTDLKPFICFNAATGAIFPYTSPMTWSGSQIHCQTYHTDLARAITSTQNKYKEIYLVLKLQIQGDESVFDPVVQSAVLQQVVLPDDWETTAEVIRETGRKVLGVSSGRRKEDKETWWWNEEVQDSIQRKRLAKKKWDMDRTEENRQEYKELQCRVKREVSKAKQKAYDELYTRLDTREGEKDLYRLARQRDRDGKDVQQVRVIKDRDGRVLTSEESVQRRWKEYFEELMNEENEREKRVEGVNSVEQKVDKIRKDEVRKALKRMKSGKAVGPDDIPVELFRRDPEVFPGQPKDIVSPACPGSSLGPLPGGACPEHLSREMSRRHPKQMPEPPQLPPFDVEEQRLYSELLPGDRAPYPISKGAPCHPTEEAHFGHLYPGSYPFGHDPELMTIETEQPLTEGHGPRSPRAPPTECYEGHGRKPSPSPQNTCGLVGQTPMNSRAPCGGYRAGPVFHD